MAKILASHFKNIDSLRKATYEELIDLPDVGNIIAQSVIAYFKEEENIQIINGLKEIGVNMDYINDLKIVNNKEFEGKTFVLTGTLTSVTREKASALIESLGGKVSSSVSAKTSCVIVGSDPGSKYEKAKELNIPIWNEEEFLAKISDE